MKKKIFSIFLTLVLLCSFSLVTAVPAAAGTGNTYTFEGSTEVVTSITPVVELTEDAFNNEPETLVVKPGAFNAQTNPVTIEGAVSALNLGTGWPNTAYVSIGLRPEATMNDRNAGVYLIAFNVVGVGTRVHLQDYTGEGAGETSFIDIVGQNSAFSYEIILAPDIGGIGGTATLNVWDSGDYYYGPVTLPYGHASTWEEDVPGELNENFSDAHLFYSIVADRRGIADQAYSATVGDITITGTDLYSVELERNWYRTDEVVNVTVDDPFANDPFQEDSVEVHAVSTIDLGGITLTLTETDVNTGVFKGSFLLIPPPISGRIGDQVVVENGNLITVEYLDVTDTAIVDDTPPVITIDDVSSPYNQLTQTITGTFTELNLDEIVLNVDSVTPPVTIDEVNGTWEVVDAPLQEGDNFIEATITDLIGNEATAQAYIELDITAPTGWIKVPEFINATTASGFPLTLHSNDDALCAWKIKDENANIVMSDAVDMLADQEITIICDLSLEADGDFTAEATFRDVPGNESFSSDTTTKDTVAPAEPSALIFSPDPINSQNSMGAILSGEGEAGTTAVYSITDVDTGKVTGEGLVDGRGLFTITNIDVSGLDDGTLTASVALRDLAGNTGLATTRTVDKHTGLPTVVITSIFPGPSAIPEIGISVTFDEGVTDFELTDVTVGNGVTSRFTPKSPTFYQFQVTAAAEGLVTVDIAEGKVHDWAGNPNEAASFSILYDGSAPVVTVINPNGGENLLGGSTPVDASDRIHWTATDDNFGDTPITIEYSLNGGVNWDTIAANVANTGAYPWVVPNLSSSHCLVRVTAVDRAGNSGSDVSDSEFTITSDNIAPAVTVNSPNGGESWLGGSTQTITWTATDDKTPPDDLLVFLAYSPNGGTDWQEIESLDYNLGAYSWEVPGVNSNQCLVAVGVRDTSGNVGYDVSDRVFTITTPGEPITTIQLSEGLNLISLMLIPTSSNITDVLAGITPAGYVESVWAYDASVEDPAERWSSYAPGAPDDLVTMVDGMGYWVKMSASAELTIFGQEMPDPPVTPPAYSVVEGWNLIGFKSTTPKVAHRYLLGIDGKYTIVRGYDETEVAYFDLEPGQKLDPGRGYWISITEPGTIYP